MRIFLSHSSYDKPLATYLAEALGPALGVSFFVLPDNAPHGMPWIEQIKLGVHESDELWSIISPESLARPWMSAEWAAFWMQGKRTTPLLVGISIERLWEPMRAFQSVVMSDVSSVMRFVRSVADSTGIEPDEGVRPLVNEIVAEIPRIREREALRDLEGAVRRLSHSIRSGTSNVDPRDVQALVSRDRLAELLQIAAGDEAADVKRKQVAVALVDAGRVGDAVRVGDHMSNLSELRTIATSIVKAIPRGASEVSEEWEALERIHGRLRKPQRRDVLKTMERSGVAPLGHWADTLNDDDSAKPA